jgi:hypothetical protein
MHAGTMRLLPAALAALVTVMVVVCGYNIYTVLTRSPEQNWAMIGFMVFFLVVMVAVLLLSWKKVFGQR